MESALDKKCILSQSTRLFDAIVYDEVDSTNKVAKELARRGRSDKTVVVADYQTAGKGRKDRKFYSPKGTGVYFSLILRPNVTAEDSVLITTATALSVAKSIEKLTENSAKIKWINDIFVNDKKCAGILTEAVFIGDRLDAVIVGIGVNISTQTFPSEVANTAGNIGAVNRNLLVANICDKLISYCDLLPSNAHLSEYKRYCFVLGREVEVLSSVGKYFAKAVDIDEKGRLIVEKCGILQKLSTEEVSVRVKSE